MDPAQTLSRLWHVPHQLRLHRTRVLIGHRLHQLHEGNLHAASSIYTYPPYFSTRARTGRINYQNTPILALQSMLSFSQYLHSSTLHCVRIECFQRRAACPGVAKRLLCGRQPFSASSDPRHPAYEMTQPFAFRVATVRRGSSASLVGHAIDRWDGKETLVIA